ncbi:lipase family protein [Nocardia yamanashiensis]|uniref:lipase family protein n=1 Tax=Nocardia yamanashiensis TaxID=209247 RepID=UPI001E64C811|nr:lipase family protein [Nocardia yamanashiensis]UGT44738.1 lipase family protein [Nocardia yamanashiensis]
MTLGDAVELPSPGDEFDAPDGRPLLPPDDPFYVSPLDPGRVPPGTVLRSRRVRLGLFGIVPQRVEAWQLLYRTADLHGAPEVAVTTVVLPWGADPGQSRPLVSFQCAIDAVAPMCLPSYALRYRARALGAIPQLEWPLVAAALARGWAVSIPDHGGLGGRFGAALEPGYRALDGVRAALRFAPLGLNPRTRVGLWGYSGGGLATAWAAELAAEYAPELDIVGAVTGSPVGDPAAAFVRLNGSPFAGFAMVFTAGLRRAYPRLDKVLRCQLSADYLKLLARAENTATFPLLARFVGRDADRHLRGGLTDFLTHPDVVTVLDQIRPGHRAPAMPMLVLQGVYDEVIAVGDIDAHVGRYLSQGVHVTYVRDRLSMHLPLQFIGIPAMAGWLADRFDDRPPTPAGTRTVWSVALDRSGRAPLLGLFGRMLAGRPIRERPAPGWHFR